MSLPHLHPEALFILQSVILVGLPFVIWRIPQIRKFIPLVVIQILVGILLGPSILGQLSYPTYESLFPPASLSIISWLSWTALLFFGLLTGLHLDFAEIKGKGKSFVVISLGSIIIPSLLGMAASWWALNLFPGFLGENATTLTFLLSMGIATGVTALPVLGAILLELQIIDKPLGKIALGYATVNDGLLWILVSVLLSLTASSHSGGSWIVIRTIVLTIIYFTLMVTVMRPLLDKLLRWRIKTSIISNGQTVIIVCFMLTSAFVTELIGIHYLLGAFVFGAIFPKRIAHELYHKIEPLVIVFLLPFFFMSTGLKTLFNVASPEVWILFVLMTIVSSFGKFFCTTIPAKFFGYSWRTSSLLG